MIAMNRFLIRLLALSALCFCWANGQDAPPLPQSAGTISASHYWSTNAAPARLAKVRTFVKACPECGQLCVSTNLVWCGGSQTERWGRVTFTCQNTNCEGESFSEELKQPVKKSAPMVETK